MISYNITDDGFGLTVKGTVEDNVADVLFLISQIYKMHNIENARRFCFLLKLKLITKNDFIFSREQEGEEH